MIQRRPWPPLIGGLVVLLLLALPVLRIRLGFGDTGNRPRTPPCARLRPRSPQASARFNGPLFLATTDPKATRQATVAVDRRHRSRPRVAFVQPAFQVGESTWAWRVYPEVGAAGRGDLGSRPPPARRRPADDRSRRARSAASPPAHRLLRLPRQPAAAVHRRRAAPQLHPADDRLPHPARAAEGGDHQPAVHRRGVRRDRGRLPVGLGRRASIGLGRPGRSSRGRR